MLRNFCLCAVLITTSAFARAGDVPRCGGRESEHLPPASNAVVFWNAVADNSIAVVGGKSPQQGSVESAIVQIAVYDAVNAICGYPFTAYAVKPDVQVPALPEAAVAAAAHDVLVALYPAQAATLDQQYADYLGAIPGHHEGKLNGIAVGQQTAAGILALRANDGRNAGPGWTPPAPGPGIWQPTPPGFLPAATPWIRFVTPWTMTSPSQFRVPSPPALDSATWVQDYNEAKDYGGAVSSVRTPEQTDLGSVRRRAGRASDAAMAWNLARDCGRSGALGSRCGAPIRNALHRRVRRTHRLLGFEVRIRFLASRYRHPRWWREPILGSGSHLDRARDYAQPSRISSRARLL